VAHLPVIVGFGGVNSAGRSSFHHGFKRLVIDQLSSAEQQRTYLSLATLMGLMQFNQDGYQDQEGNDIAVDQVANKFGQHILDHTLLRKIEPNLFDVDNVDINHRVTIDTEPGSTCAFLVPKKSLPNNIPANWTLTELDNDPDRIKVEVQGNMELFFPDTKKAPVQTAGQLPSGFDPGSYYNSTNHPRGLQMTVFSTTDAIKSTGIDWEVIRDLVPPDQVGVYAGSGHGQMDETGGGGLMKALALGKRTSSRQLPLSLVDMPSNFINAYIVGNLGHTGTQIAACATFLYNLELAMKEIRSGKRRVAIVGNSEAPVLPELMEGYRAMSALAEDSRLMSLNKTETITHQHRATSCRPFSENIGFTLSESSQFIILFDDDLVLDTGAQIFGSIGDIFIKADGFKKSISSPGFGNYITLAKAAASVRAILGEKSLRERTFVSAHGSGTPLNRTTESHGLNEIAKAFKIDSWPITAVKCYLGHPLTPASGDQLATALGTWATGILPGIFTLNQIADDVHTSNLSFSQAHVELGINGTDAAFLNAKGFGGNNVTGVALSPQVTSQMIERKHGKKALNSYLKKNESIREAASSYDQEATQGKFEPYYRDSERVLGENDLELTDKYLRVPGYKKEIDLNLENPYPDMDSDAD
jgi:acetoacetyl-[acyl-carrier protein] synthase